MSSDERRATAASQRIAADMGDEYTHPQGTAPAAAWEPTNVDQCQSCGAHVTSRFRKCLGDANNIAHACRQCADQNDLYCGAAADPDYEPRVQADGGGR